MDRRVEVLKYDRLCFGVDVLVWYHFQPPQSDGSFFSFLAEYHYITKVKVVRSHKSRYRVKDIMFLFHQVFAARLGAEEQLGMNSCEAKLRKRMSCMEGQADVPYGEHQSNQCKHCITTIC